MDHYDIDVYCKDCGDYLYSYLDKPLEGLCDECKDLSNKENINTRVTDEGILIRFAKDKGIDLVEVIDAANRLEYCINKGLTDYSAPDDSCGE